MFLVFFKKRSFVDKDIQTIWLEFISVVYISLPFSEHLLTVLYIRYCTGAEDLEMSKKCLRH